MATSKLAFLLCFFAVWAFNAVQSASAPAPGVDCTSLVLNLADCLSFVQNGSNVYKPEGTCCSGLKTVLKTDARCLCEGFKNSASFGVVLNVTKATTLPAACKVSAPSVANCKMSTSPGAAPAAAMTPESSPAPSATTPSPTAALNSMVPAPSPSRGSSGSSRLAFSAASLFMGLVTVVALL